MYLDALARHIVDREIEGEVNTADDGLLHSAAIAWNALAYLEKYLIAMEKEENGNRF